jgi:sugar phosphate isomerase/epimerase
MATKITPDMFSNRSFQVICEKMKLETLEQVAKCSEWDLRREPNFGLKSLKEVKEVLATHGLYLASKSSWNRPELSSAAQAGAGYLDMLRALRVIAEFPLAESTSPDSAAVYMRALARHILGSEREA